MGKYYTGTNDQYGQQDAFLQYLEGQQQTNPYTGQVTDPMNMNIQEPINTFDASQSFKDRLKKQRQTISPIRQYENDTLQYDITTGTGKYDFNPYFKGLNTLAQGATFLANQKNDIDQKREERNRYLKALMPKPQFNQYEDGLNNIPMYKGGGQNPAKVYTDRKQFEQAQRMYNDSLNLYNYTKFQHQLEDGEAGLIGKGFSKIANFANDNPGNVDFDKRKKLNENRYNNINSTGQRYKESDRNSFLNSGVDDYEKNKKYQPLYNFANTMIKNNPDNIAYFNSADSPDIMHRTIKPKGSWTGYGQNWDYSNVYPVQPVTYQGVENIPKGKIYAKIVNNNSKKANFPNPIQRYGQYNAEDMEDDINSIFPQQYILPTGSINIQGQPLPFPQFQLPQQKGTPVYGPGNTIIGYSDNMNFKPAYQYTGAPNNTLNLQDKALLENPEALRKYVMLKDNYKFQSGGSITSNNPPTTSDSLNLYNNALLVDKFYANNPEYKTVPAVRRISTDPSFHKKEIKNIKTKKILTEKDKKILKWHEENLKSALTKTPLSAHMLNQQAVGFYQEERLRNLIKNGNIDKDIFPLEKYRKDLNDNQYYQREIQHGTLNLNSPYQLFDNRIEPQNQKQYLYNKNGIVDGVTTFQYDPIAIKPTHLRNIDDWQYLNKTYGSKIPTNIPNPTQSTISSLKPELPQQKGTPVYGPGNTIVGYSDNMNFTPAYEYTGAPNNQLNLQDKELLNNPEALRKYILSRDTYKFPVEEFQNGGKKESKQAAAWRILREGKDRHGNKLTDKQKKFFAAMGRAKYEGGGPNPYLFTTEDFVGLNKMFPLNREDSKYFPMDEVFDNNQMAQYSFTPVGTHYNQKYVPYYQEPKQYQAPVYSIPEVYNMNTSAQQPIYIQPTPPQPIQGRKIFMDPNNPTIAAPQNDIWNNPNGSNPTNNPYERKPYGDVRSWFKDGGQVGEEVEIDKKTLLELQKQGYKFEIL